jgi:hypothetical protein
MKRRLWPCFSESPVLVWNTSFNYLRNRIGVVVGVSNTCLHVCHYISDFEPPKDPVLHFDVTHLSVSCVRPRYLAYPQGLSADCSSPESNHVNIWINSPQPSGAEGGCLIGLSLSPAGSSPAKCSSNGPAQQRQRTCNLSG